MKEKRKSFGLTTKIFIGLFLGFITGVIVYQLPTGPFKDDFLINGIFTLVGQIFLRAIMMMVVPLVFVSLVNGAASIGDVKKLGRVGMKTVLFYLITTAIAISLALGIAAFVKPGQSLDLSSIKVTETTINEKVPLVQVLYEMVPNNPIAAMNQGNMLQIIVFAILTGVGLAALGEKAKTIIRIFEELNSLMMKMVGIVMLIAPYGVFGLIAKTFATVGYEAMGSLAKYMLTVIFVLILHALLTYSTFLKILTGLSPITFFKKFFPAISVAFSTSSSNATVPVTLEMVEERLGVSKNIASFTIPLGATINMDGTAIMQGVATIFIAQVYGLDLSFSAILTVILTATLASIGTAGVPGVGLIMLSMVLKAINLPIEGIGLIMGIDRILDMTRTAVNITGDAVCTIIIAKGEGEINEELYNAELEVVEAIE